jgi:hypothetical protein
MDRLREIQGILINRTVRFRGPENSDKLHENSDKMHGRLDKSHGQTPRSLGHSDTLHGRLDKPHENSEKPHGHLNKPHGQTPRSSGHSDTPQISPNLRSVDKKSGMMTVSSRMPTSPLVAKVGLTRTDHKPRTPSTSNPKSPASLRRSSTPVHTTPPPSRSHTLRMSAGATLLGAGQSKMAVRSSSVAMSGAGQSKMAVRSLPARPRSEPPGSMDAQLAPEKSPVLRPKHFGTERRTKLAGIPDASVDAGTCQVFLFAILYCL